MAYMMIWAAVMVISFVGALICSGKVKQNSGGLANVGISGMFAFFAALGGISIGFQLLVFVIALLILTIMELAIEIVTE